MQCQQFNRPVTIAIDNLKHQINRRREALPGRTSHSIAIALGFSQALLHHKYPAKTAATEQLYHKPRLFLNELQQNTLELHCLLHNSNRQTMTSQSCGRQGQLQDVRIVKPGSHLLKPHLLLVDISDRHNHCLASESCIKEN